VEKICMHCWTPVEEINYAHGKDGEVMKAGRGKQPVYKHKAGLRTDCQHNNLRESEVVEAQ
jgi:hypothetical protein